MGCYFASWVPRTCVLLQVILKVLRQGEFGLIDKILLSKPICCINSINIPAQAHHISLRSIHGALVDCYGLDRSVSRHIEGGWPSMKVL